MLALSDVAAAVGLRSDDLLWYGRDKAKLPLALLETPRRARHPPKLVLVSAITPTPAGEGKTTTAIGLADALRRRGHAACLALREPSLGPCFGVKGGGTGGGRSQLHPAVDINLHFTGDFHAITAAHNLLAALIDNQLHHRTALRLDPKRIHWRRVLDMNDRALRGVIVGLGGPGQGIPRETGFDITAASELMAMLCLAEGVEDLRARVERTLIAFDMLGEPVTASRIGGTGAVLALLRDAILPNLVQTLEGTPAFVHGGPFANIAHGCNSVLATRFALHFGDYAITEAGFGFDLGAEKFFDIKCTQAKLNPAAVVLVATLRALKLHGGVRLAAVAEPNPEAVRRGLPNLQKHVENVQRFGHAPIIALNRFPTDTNAELAVVQEAANALGLPLAPSDHFARGGEGAEALADAVVQHARAPSGPVVPLYSAHDSVPDKIATVARTMYGARGLKWSRAGRRDLAEVERLGYASLPVCVAKTPMSLSDDPKKLSRPTDFDVTVERIQINAGAGFLVVCTGDILRMPGLPAEPRATAIDLRDGVIVGVG